MNYQNGTSQANPYYNGLSGGTNPLPVPQYVYHQWVPMMGLDPNAGLIAAMNRLAAALEKFNERDSK